MKKFVEVSHENFVALNTGRNFTSEIRMIKFIHNELSKKKLIRSLLAQQFNVERARCIAERIKGATTKELSGSKSKGKIKLYFTLLYN